MSSTIIIRLKGLPLSARAADVRTFFAGLRIPEGGVHIVGGPDGDCFIAFSSDDDARQAFAKNRQHIHGQEVNLLLSSRSEMNDVIARARTAAGLDTAPESAAAPVVQNANAPVYSRPGYEPAYARNPAPSKYQEQHTTPDNNQWPPNGNPGGGGGAPPPHHTYRQEGTVAPRHSLLANPAQQQQQPPKHNYEQVENDYRSPSLSRPPENSPYRSNGAFPPSNGPPQGDFNGPPRERGFLPANAPDSRLPPSFQMPPSDPFASGYRAHFDVPPSSTVPSRDHGGPPDQGHQVGGGGGYHGSLAPPTFQSPSTVPYGDSGLSNALGSLDHDRPTVPPSGESWKRPSHEFPGHNNMMAPPTGPPGSAPPSKSLPPPPSGPLQWPPGFEPKKQQQAPPISPFFPSQNLPPQSIGGRMPILGGGPPSGVPPFGANPPFNLPPAFGGPAPAQSLAPPTLAENYVELSRLPPEMLRPSVLEEWLRPTVALKLSSVKTVYDRHGRHESSLVRFESYEDMQRALQRDGENGIRVRKCSKSSFDSAVDGIPASPTATRGHSPSRDRRERDRRDRERGRERERDGRKRSPSPRRRRRSREGARDPKERGGSRRVGKRSRSRSRDERSANNGPPSRRSRSPHATKVRRCDSRTPSPARPHKLDDPARFMMQLKNMPFKCKDWDVIKWLDVPMLYARRTAYEDGNASDRWICEFNSKKDRDVALSRDKQMFLGRRIRTRWIGSHEADRYLSIPDRFGEKRAVEFAQEAEQKQMEEVTSFGAFSTPVFTNPALPYHNNQGAGDVNPMQGQNGAPPMGGVGGPVVPMPVSPLVDGPPQRLMDLQPMRGRGGPMPMRGARGRGMMPMGPMMGDFGGRGRGMPGGPFPPRGLLRGGRGMRGGPLPMRGGPGGPPRGGGPPGAANTGRATLLPVPQQSGGPPTCLVVSDAVPQASPPDICKFLGLPTAAEKAMKRSADGTVYVDCGDPEKAMALMRKSRSELLGKPVTLTVCTIAEAETKMQNVQRSGENSVQNGERKSSPMTGGGGATPQKPQNGNGNGPQVEIDPEEAARLGPAGTVLVCAGFPANIALEDVLQFFSGYPVKADTVRIRMDNEGTPTGDCMLAVDVKESAEKAATALNGKVLLGQKIAVVVSPS